MVHENSGIETSPTRTLQSNRISCAVYFFSLLAAYFTFKHLPLKSSKDALFSVDNTKKYLNDIVSFGVRRAGSIVNEIHVPAYLIAELKKIKQTIPPHVTFEVDVQHPSGKFFHKFLNGFTNVYSNVTNVIVRLSWRDQDKSVGRSNAVLVNAHYDSFVTSVGASDDALGVALIVELSRALAEGDSLPHDVILLLNGAEESNQQAAHGFISQHRWAKNVRAVVNLEAIGAGGRQLVFQCNSGWLAKVYGKSVQNPQASVISHELFKHFLWRGAATDWSTFLQFGKPGIVGTDSAFIEDGYAYHTSFDTVDLISDRTILHTGENLIRYVQSLAHAPEMAATTGERLKEANDKDAAANVYFDFIGKIFVSYSGWRVYTIHYTAGCLGAILSLYHFGGLIPAFMAFAKKATIFLAGPLSGALVGSVYALVAPFRWYQGGIFLAIWIFVPPILTAIEVIQHSFGFVSNPARDAFRDNSMAGILLWSVLLLVGTRHEVFSCYVLVLGIILATLSINGLDLDRDGHKAKGLALTGSALLRTQLASAACLAPLFLYHSQVALTLLTLALPTVGKTGTVVPGDIIAGGLIGLLVSMMSVFPLAGTTLTNFGLATRFHPSLCNPEKIDSSRDELDNCNKDASRSKKSPHAKSSIPCLPAFCAPAGAVNRSCAGWPWQGLSRGAYLNGMVFVCVSTLLTCVVLPSYSRARPKRLWVQHIERNFSLAGGGYDSGLWVSGMDGRGLWPLQHAGVARLDGRHATYSRRILRAMEHQEQQQEQQPHREPSAGEQEGMQQHLWHMQRQQPFAGQSHDIDHDSSFQDSLQDSPQDSLEDYFDSWTKWAQRSYLDKKSSDPSESGSFVSRGDFVNSLCLQLGLCRTSVGKEVAAGAEESVESAVRRAEQVIEQDLGSGVNTNRKHENEMGSADIVVSNLDRRLAETIRGESESATAASSPISGRVEQAKVGDAGEWGTRALKAKKNNPAAAAAAAVAAVAGGGGVKRAIRKNCNVWTGDCYLQWPWYFSVAEAIRHSFYLPAVPPVVADASRLHLEVQRWALPASPVLPIPASLAASLPQACPASDNPSEKDTGAGAGAGAAGAMRLVLLKLSGPSHMHLVIRDNAVETKSSSGKTKKSKSFKDIRGSRLLLWGFLNPYDGNTSFTTRRPRENVQGKFEQSIFEDMNLESPPHVRDDDVFLAQIGFGFCPQGEARGCTQLVGLVLCGEAEVDVAAYGHYVHAPTSKPLEELSAEMPEWSKGAEWAYFTSSLIAAKV